ncbi:olfactory receptor 6N1-like [Salvelinus alpinus]
MEKLGATNSLRHTYTGLTPFQCVLGYYLALAPRTLNQTAAPAVDEWFRRAEVWNAAHMRLQPAVRRIWWTATADCTAWNNSNTINLQETFNKSVYFILSLITYLLIITVNLTLIITIIQEKGLHEPMYIFLCSLCVNGLYGTSGFYPKLLLDLQSDVQVISYGGCLTQAYVIYTSVMCEISTLTVMSYDRYVAICRPLLYHTIVTSLTVRKLLLFSWCYPLFISLIALSLTARIPLCGSRIDKIFCDNPSILKHACLPITINQFLNKCMILVHVLEILFIVFSYCQIVRTCVKSAKGRIKFTQTCVPHLITIVIFITN